ncbi:MAG: Carbohydrate kinase, FGGY-like protein [Nocardioidaceae bacterium]|nr:Carbohydrate kinase, FGGY-like protein [Nocardioidaceae bacterium]
MTPRNARAPVWVGVDVGTSALKILALHSDGAVAGSVEKPLPVHRPLDDRAEADPQDWLDEVRTGLDAVLAERGKGAPAGIGVTGQMHGTVLVDGMGAPVGPAVLWPDGRAADQEPRWAALPPPVQARLGSPFSPGMTGPVLGWLGQHEADTLVAAERVWLPKDWVRRGLTGESVPDTVTDPSDASATLLWDVPAGAWSPDALALTGAARTLTPAVVPSDTVVGRWAGPADGEAPVVAGAGDTPASLYALEHSIGGWRPGDVVINLGTGAQVIAPASPPPDPAGGLPQHHVWADAGGGHYAMVAVQNAGLALDWARAELGLSWPELVAAAQRASTAGDGIVFAPFVAGERGRLAPREWLRGPRWLGRSGRARVEERARAAIDAQVFLVRRAYELLGADARRVLLVGGGGRDPVVRQLMADCVGASVHWVQLGSAAATGAALLAAHGTGAELTPSATPVETAPSPSPAVDEAYLAWCAAVYGD